MTYKVLLDIIIMTFLFYLILNLGTKIDMLIVEAIFLLVYLNCNIILFKVMLIFKVLKHFLALIPLRTWLG